MLIFVSDPLPPQSLGPAGELSQGAGVAEEVPAEDGCGLRGPGEEAGGEREGQDDIQVSLTCDKIILVH